MTGSWQNNWIQNSVRIANQQILICGWAQWFRQKSITAQVPILKKTKKQIFFDYLHDFEADIVYT